MDDAAVVSRQLGRAPRAFRRVVARCPFGRPAVTEQEPYDDAGRPFPTTYWLTCPHLVAAVSRLEAAGQLQTKPKWPDRPNLFHETFFYFNAHGVRKTTMLSHS